MRFIAVFLTLSKQMPKQRLDKATTSFPICYSAIFLLFGPSNNTKQNISRIVQLVYAVDIFCTLCTVATGRWWQWLC
jgi:hypothetical protein